MHTAPCASHTPLFSQKGLHLYKTLMLLVLVHLPLQAECPHLSPALDIGYNVHPTLEEISGMIASRRFINLFWVHNDSGDEARFYAMDIGGNHRGTFLLPGRRNYDFEDIAIGPGPNGRDYLYIGDIGDNRAKRDQIEVLRIVEPDPLEPNRSTALSSSVVFTFVFEDGSRDAESLFIDPCSGDLYVISKREDKSRLYMAQAPFENGGTYPLEFKVELPWGWTTAADISPNYRYIAVRSYRNAGLWPILDDRPLWQSFQQPECPITLMDEPQGESISFDHSGCCLVTISEYTEEWLYHYQIKMPGEEEPAE